MSITATFVRRLPEMQSDAALYHLSEPITYRELDDETFTTEDVVVSAVRVLGEPETYIFAADHEGNIVDWAELDGSFRGALDHRRAIEGAGWTVGS